jgi:TolB protein
LTAERGGRPPAAAPPLHIRPKPAALSLHARPRLAALPLQVRPALAALALSLALCPLACRERAPSPEGAPSARPLPAASASASASASAARSASASAAAIGRAGPPLGDDERRALSGRIAFVAERDGNREVYLLDPATLAERRLTESPLDEYPMAPSPDGGELLLATADERSGPHAEQLARVPLAGGALTAFGPRSARVRNPSFTPDGRTIVFEADTASFSDIYAMRPDGSSVRRLTSGGLKGNFSPAPSPDGKTIAFVSSRDGDPEIYAMNVDGSKARRLTAFHAEDWAPAWSPGGERLAFLSSREGAEHIFLMAPSGADQRRLTAAVAPNDAERRAAREAGPGTNEADVAWAPSGRKLAFRANPPGGKSTLRLFDFDTERVTDLTDGTHGDSTPAWSPDGRYIVFASDRSGDGDLYVMRADGSGQTRLTHAPGADWLPRWLASAPSKGAGGAGGARPGG